MKNDVRSVTSKGCHLDFFFFFVSVGLCRQQTLFSSERIQVWIEIAFFPLIMHSFPG